MFCRWLFCGFEGVTTLQAYENSQLQMMQPTVITSFFFSFYPSGIDSKGMLLP